MRIAVHDYSGHPFQVQLSRELARRGHDVLHLHCPSYTTGKGALERRADDPPGFDVAAVALGESVAKYSVPRRIRQEAAYGRRFARRVAAFAPDVLLSANAPLFSAAMILRSARRRRIPLVFWQQDIYSVAMQRHAEQRLWLAGRPVGAAFVALERRIARGSAAVVVISEDFLPTLVSWRVPLERVHVIENWAPLDELPTRPRDNDWSRENGLVGKRVVLYSGTLGLKHNPQLLLRVAERSRDEDDVRVVVVSEGLGADWLRERAVPNLVLLPFQPYERLPDVLASADVVAAILEPGAGVFSVPSKVLTYHCAGRPLVAAIPRSNLAARIVERNESGLVVDATDGDGFAAAARRLLADRDLRERLGRNARAYAERAFDIEHIGDSFERVLADAAGRRG